MSKTRFTPWIVLACIGTLAGCTSGEGGTAGNTELNVLVPNGAATPDGLPPAPDNNNGSSAPALIDIQVVEYTVACNDGPSGPFLDNGATLNDDVTISGVLEVLDTPSAGVTTQDFGDDLTDVYVWQGFMDLPPTGLCTVQLRARDADGEVICTATEEFSIEADSTTKVNVLMYCGLSFQAPVGMLDLDGDFSFNVANFCPDLFVLNCIDSELNVRTVPIAGDVLATACQVRFRDGDSSCGGDGVLPADGGTDPDGASSCDPQDCDVTPEGLDCAPRSGFVDPVVTTTVVCSSTQGACGISCDGVTPSPTGTCTFTGVDLGNGVTGIVGNIGDGPPAPLSPGPGGFFVACATIDDDGDSSTPEVPATPGDDITCTATTTDGDTACNKIKVVDLTIEGLSACQEFTGGGGSCDDNNDCTIDECNDATCQGDVATCCTNTNAPENTQCEDSGGFDGLCDDAGNCVSADCNAQPDPTAFCQDTNVCTVGTCEAGGNCTQAAANENGDCVSGSGSGDGSCSAGSCVSNDECTAGDVSGCPAPAECFDATCDESGAPYVCDTAPSAAGTPCTSVTNGACDGAGVCEAPPLLSAGSGSTQWGALTDAGQGGSLGFGSVEGCEVFVTVLNATIYLDVLINLTVDSDGNNNVTTSWDLQAYNLLLPTLANAAQYAGITIGAEVTTGNATVGGTLGGIIGSVAEPASLVANRICSGPYSPPDEPAISCTVDGDCPADETCGSPSPIGDFLEPQQIPNSAFLQLATPSEITQGSGVVVPTGSSGETVTINWTQDFLLNLWLNNSPLVDVDSAACIFNQTGAGVDFTVQ